MPKSLFDKIWEAHEVADGLIYVDLHLVHEVTSPQAFEGLRLGGRAVRRPDKTVATADHNVPTDGTHAARMIADELSRVQVETLERNCEEFGVPLYSLGSERQGIVHVIGPELGLTQPGLTVVCGDSHTATHGAFGALAIGDRDLRGRARAGHPVPDPAAAEDDADRVLGRARCGRHPQGPDPGDDRPAGHRRDGRARRRVRGAVISALSMEGRMTICNMTIEGGGRAGMIAPDEVTFECMSGRPGVPEDFDAAVGALARAADRRRRELRPRGRDRRRLAVAHGHLGNDPRDGGRGHGFRTRPRRASSRPADRESAERALTYMALEPGTPMPEIPLDRVFIGSCTNSRVERPARGGDRGRGAQGVRLDPGDGRARAPRR